jgi:hypothetical protein
MRNLTLDFPDEGALHIIQLINNIKKIWSSHSSNFDIKDFVYRISI